MKDTAQLEMKLHKLTDKLGRIVSRMEILEKKIVEHNDKLETLHKELEEVREKV
jgi:peptidoglycan hydrolase CwlO-like protein